ncbi:MAG: ATP synthase subunit I [Tepidimonas sp.]|uniref:ATP synthase subunit I n=1 Tax=Tepidimonas sp. TaxID=2002775 RepID=UPI004054F353
MWHVVVWQAVLTLLVSVIAAVGVAATGGQRWSVVASVAYGGCSALIPSAVMAWGLTSKALARWLRAAFPGAARASLAVWLCWEGVKVLLVLAMLWSAPRWISDLSWLGVVVGLVVALKSYWLTWIVRPPARS